MSLALFADHCLAPSLSDLKQRQAAEKGLADARAGRRPASHARAYTAAYERGLTFRRMAARELALVIGSACRCPQCREIYTQALGGTCHCTPLGTPLAVGVEVLYGTEDLEEGGLFYAPEELLQLALEGVEVLTEEGERLNEQILLQ